MSCFVSGKWMTLYSTESEIPDTMYDVDEDRTGISVEIDTKYIVDEYMRALIMQAYRENPEIAKWLEMKKLNYELTRRFD